MNVLKLYIFFLLQLPVLPHCAYVLVRFSHKNHMVIRKRSCFGLPGSVGINMAGNIPNFQCQHQLKSI